MFKQCADIQTADMLKLPVPEITGGKPTIVKLPPSELQRRWWRRWVTVPRRCATAW